MKIRTRFAPSPTGFMHIGNLRTALYAYLFARHNDGDFILRIEDTDQERYVEGAVELIYKTLKASGMEHDEGPDKDGGFGPYIQSERVGMYAKYAHDLVDKGGAYYCFCGKERLEELSGTEGVHKYDKHCLKNISTAVARERIANGEKFVIRQNIPQTEGASEYDDLVYGNIKVEYKDLEDTILLKSDGFPTYNFANVIDDHTMNITHVIRGTEYLSSTPKYNLLYDAFGWERPQYMHLPPIMKDATRKLSKRYGDANFDDFIKKGYLSEAIVNYIALLGWSPKNDKEKMSIEELISLFNVAGVSKSSSIFDENKMKWLNGEYIRELPFERFNEIAKPFFDKSCIAGLYDYTKMAKLLHQRVEILSDVIEKVAFLVAFQPFNIELFTNKKWKTDASLAKEMLPVIISELETVGEWNEENVHAKTEEIIAKLAVKKGQVLWILRIAITNTENTPGGAIELADLLGKDECISRMKIALGLCV